VGLFPDGLKKLHKSFPQVIRIKDEDKQNFFEPTAKNRPFAG
jgi:hypothetical protein